MTEFDGLPLLRSPVAIAAFEGWNDAADASTAAVEHLEQVWQAREITTIDPEDFYDFQATRPRITMVDGDTREIVWPAVELFEARVPRAPRDLILLVGTEPSFHWRTFTSVIIELAEAIGTQLVVTDRACRASSS